MRETRIKNVLPPDEQEYNLSDELAAELKRFVSKLTGRKVTGALTVHLADGGINAVKLREAAGSARTE